MNGREGGRNDKTQLKLRNNDPFDMDLLQVQVTQSV